MALRVVDDESEPLTREELQARGNELLKDARDGALDALRASTRPDIFNRVSYSVYTVRDMQRQADAAAAAWMKVSGALGELLNEYDKARIAWPQAVT
jgi:hypothetical protein